MGLDKYCTYSVHTSIKKRKYHPLNSILKQQIITQKLYRYPWWQLFPTHGKSVSASHSLRAYFYLPLLKVESPPRQWVLPLFRVTFTLELLVGRDQFGKGSYCLSSAKWLKLSLCFSHYCPVTSKIIRAYLKTNLRNAESWECAYVVLHSIVEIHERENTAALVMKY